MNSNLKKASAWLLAMVIGIMQTTVLATEIHTENTYMHDSAVTFLTESETVLAGSDLPDNDELFLDYVNRLLYPDRVISTFGISARARLDEQDQLLYDLLKVNIENVAAGEQASTAFVLDTDILAQNGVKFTWTNTELGVDSITDFQAVLIAFYAQFNTSKVWSALRHDCPYNLYWFDKTSTGGILSGARISRRGYGSVCTAATITSPTIIFRVAAAYQPASGYNPYSPTVDTAKTSAATAAVTNANAIVNRYASLSDYEKLVAYRDEICDLVSYNHDAVSESYTGGYGDPWQLIYVFDGNDQTNVVCEGYAKAFQYLCDLSTFTNDVACYTVVGVMSGGTGAGGHMWNIVTMEDGKNYLVDITNSDSGTIGRNGGLFLSGTTGSVTEGYQFTIGTSVRILFEYDPDESIALWGADADSILNLAANDYASGVLAEHLPVLGAFADTLTVTKSNSRTTTLVNIKPIGNNPLPEISLYTAVYDASGKLLRVVSTPGEMVNGEVTLSIAQPSTSANETYKFMLWADNLTPIIATM